MQINNYRRRRRFVSWQSWTISITIFSIIVLLARSPPHESNSNFTTVKLGPRDHISFAKGDTIVTCMLTTPHAQKNATYQPAEGIIKIHVHRQLAPNAADAFLSLVSSKHFDGNYIFRVVPGFIVQWGIESPKNGMSKTKFAKVDIDPPPSNYDSRRANVRGTLNFAGGSSGTGQVYINKADNKHLDKEKGSLPFASLGEESMKIIDAIYDHYKQGSGQVKAVNNNEVDKFFPNMSQIKRCWLA
jgi:peptidyl-prolyl cis-trans isomerase A (cyclophilin A)